MSRRTFLVTGASQGIGLALFVDGGASTGEATI